VSFTPQIAAPSGPHLATITVIARSASLFDRDADMVLPSNRHSLSLWRTIAIINPLVPNIVGPGYRRASTASRVNAAAQGLQGNQILIFTAHVVPTGWVSASRNSWLSDCRVGATFAEQIGAKAVSPPMRDRIYKEYPPGKAPERLQRLASKIRDANGP
jgi:hypothetical protein